MSRSSERRASRPSLRAVPSVERTGDTTCPRLLWQVALLALAGLLVLSAAASLGGCDDSGSGDGPGDTATLDAAADTSGNDGDEDSLADTAGEDTAADTEADADDTSGGDTAQPDTEPDTTVECDPPNGMRPPRLSEHAGVFDTQGNQLVIHGGSLGIPENCGFPTPSFETTTWLYDVACDQWTTLEGGPALARHAAAYDSTARRMIVFGGRYRATTSGNYTVLAETWALDLATGTWSELATTGTTPPGRVNHAMVYDPAAHRVLVFGGSSQTGLGVAPLADVWALDLDTLAWSDVTPAVPGPDPRLWVSGLWDASRGWFVIFGGGDDGAFTGSVDYFEDVWAFGDAGGTPAWIRLDLVLTQQPAGRFWAGWAHDADADRYVLFGGHDDGNTGAGDDPSVGNRNDVWLFDPFAGSWSRHQAGDIYNRPANGFCDFPPDFTTIDPALPERRNAHVFVAGNGGAFTMGGKTDCGVIDDLAHLDFATGTWQTLTRATQGEVCLRRGGGDSCSDLCL